MRYVSTRGAWADAPQPFSAILLEGLAPDGGLAVPEAYPRLTDAEQAALRRVSYPELAFAVLSRYCTDIPADDLKAIVDAHVHEGGVRQRRDRAGHGSGAGRAPAARVERAFARVQGHRAAASRQPVRIHAREERQHG